MILAGRVNRQQQEENNYPRTMNQALIEKSGKKRIPHPVPATRK